MFNRWVIIQDFDFTNSFVSCSFFFFRFPEMAPELTQLDVERLASGVSKTLHGLSDHLGDFHKLLESPPRVSNSKVSLQSGVLLKN